MRDETTAAEAAANPILEAAAKHAGANASDARDDAHEHGAHEHGAAETVNDTDGPVHESIDGVPALRALNTWDEMRALPVSWSQGKNSYSDIVRCDATWGEFFPNVITKAHQILGPIIPPDNGERAKRSGGAARREHLSRAAGGVL